MLQKDPKLRISAKEALSHPWVVSKGLVEEQEKPQVTMLTSAQENMKKFQEKYANHSEKQEFNNPFFFYISHRFNVKNIKPKDLDNPNAMERSLHCPSPVINGRLTTVVESKRNKGQMVPPGKKSYFSSKTDADNPTIEETDDIDQTDDQPQIGNQIDKYKNNFNKLSTIKDGANTSANSSVNNTPVLKPKVDDKKTMLTKARNIQGNLLNLIKPTGGDSGFTVSSYYKDSKDKGKTVSNVRSNLMGLH